MVSSERYNRISDRIKSERDSQTFTLTNGCAPPPDLIFVHRSNTSDVSVASEIF